MVKRAISKRWAVEPGYEPPLTRLKVRENPHLAPPRTQDVPLPTRTRRRRVVASPVAPQTPVQNAAVEEMEQGSTANEARSVEQMMEIATENQTEEVAARNQPEETTEGNQMEVITMETQIMVTGNRGITVSQLSKILEEQSRQSVTDAAHNEMVPENPTEANTEGGQIDIEVPCGREEPAAPEIQMEETIDGSQIETNRSAFQFLYTPPWTAEDQRTYEEEIRVASAKPKTERSYSWNLIVGMSGVSQVGAGASDLMLGNGAALENGNSQAVKASEASGGIALTKKANTAAEKLVAVVSAGPDKSADKPGKNEAPRKVDAVEAVANVGTTDKQGSGVSHMMISSVLPSSAVVDKGTSNPDADRMTDEEEDEVVNPEVTGLRAVFARGLGNAVRERGRQQRGSVKGRGGGRQEEEEHGSVKEGGRQEERGHPSNVSNGAPILRPIIKRDKSAYTQAIHLVQQKSLLDPEKHKAEMETMRLNGVSSISSGTVESELKYIVPGKWIPGQMQTTSGQSNKISKSEKATSTQAIYMALQQWRFDDEQHKAEMANLRLNGIDSISSDSPPYITPGVWLSEDEVQKLLEQSNAPNDGAAPETHAALNNLQRPPPVVTIQKQTSPVLPVSPQVTPPLQQQLGQLPSPPPMDLNNGEAGNEPQQQADAPSVLDALQRNALLLQCPDPTPFDKLDIITDRRFRVDPHFERLKIPNAQLQFTVVSYSIMAELETEAEEARAEGYLGIGIEAADDAPWKNRDLVPINFCDRVLMELDYLKSDILCIQSIAEWYWAKLERTLNNLGYYGYMMNRRPGPGNYCEAIFFRTKRFMIVTRDGAFLDELITEQSGKQADVIHTRGVRESVKSREVVVMMTLRCKQSGRKFRVVNIRCAQEHKHRPDLQAIQVCSVLQRLNQLNAEPNGRMPTILCGNMDFQPDNQGPYQNVRDGFLGVATSQWFNSIESAPISTGHKCPLTVAYGSGFKHSMSNLKSAYDKVLGSEPPTVWKRASNSFVCGSYVWFDEAELSLVGVLDMVSSSAVTDSGIPNDQFPSGSLSLKARFQFRVEDAPPTAAAANQGV